MAAGMAAAVRLDSWNGAPAAARRTWSDVLILAAGRPLLEIAPECGFGSKSAFNQAFEPASCMSPSAYRKSLPASAVADQPGGPMRRRPCPACGHRASDARRAPIPDQTVAFADSRR